MNKEAILEKSRNEHQDEGMREAENRGRRIGFTMLSLMFVVITGLSLIYGRDVSGPMAMYWAFIAVESYPRYRFTGSRVYLWTMIAGGLGAALDLTIFVLNLVR